MVKILILKKYVDGICKICNIETNVGYIVVASDKKGYIICESCLKSILEIFRIKPIFVEVK